MANEAASLAAATAFAFAVFNEADDLFSRALYAATAAFAFLADVAACVASFFDLYDTLLAYLASLSERTAFFADTEAAFLIPLAIESDFYAFLAAALAAILAALASLASLATFAFAAAA